MTNLQDLMVRLRDFDTLNLVEILDISSDDIVDRFPDRIEEKYNKVMEDYDNS